MKKYELLLIFPSSMKEDMLEKNLERVRGEITKLSGVVSKTEVLGGRTFARTMNKQDSGTYVRMNVELETKDMATLHARMKLNEEIFRYQMVVEEKRPAAPAKAPEGASVEEPAGR